MPLTIAQAGRPLRITAIHAGQHLQTRLSAMGIMPGEEIEVLRNSLRGPFLVLIKGSRVMLGRGMAQKIQVE